MKKTYIVPATIMVAVDNDTTILSVSPGGVQSEALDIGYGGIDENGEIIPASRFTGVWDEWDF